MFVPNYRHRDDEINEIEGGGYRIKVFRENGFQEEVDGYYCIFSDGSCSQYEEVLDQTEYIRILLPCPYCGAQISQDERVECECGWKLASIHPDVVDFMLKKIPVSFSTAKDLQAKDYQHLEFVINPPIGDDGNQEVLIIYHWNNIHWLELSPGKEKK